MLSEYDFLSEFFASKNCFLKLTIMYEEWKWSRSKKCIFLIECVIILKPVFGVLIGRFHIETGLKVKYDGTESQLKKIIQALRIFQFSEKRCEEMNHYSISC